MVLRMKVKDVKLAGRATRGNHMMDVKEGDRVASIARIATAELKRVGAKTNGGPEADAGPQIKLPLN